MWFAAMPDYLLDIAKRLRGCRVLVTGGAGFVGFNLLRLLSAAGAEVHAVIRYGSSSWRLVDIVENVLIHQLDLTDEKAFEALFARVQPDFVFHLAMPRGDTEAVRDEMLNFNVHCSIFLARLVLKYGVKRLIVAGSSLEYAPSAEALSEGNPIEPRTWHGVTKAAATLIYRQAAQTNELPVVVLRLFHVYGPWESSHRLGPTAICASFSGNTIKLTESGIRRDWIFIDDVCEALILAVDKGSNGDVINIGTGKETSNEGIVACIESITGRHINLAEGFYPRRITDLEHRFADFSLARKQLGWQPRHNLKIGFSRTIDWYLANSQAWSNPYDKKYTVV